jgi:hypothetical protein
MKVKNVFILKEAVDDLDEGKSFYDFQEHGVGEYFFDCIVADIESLIIFAGIHRKKSGLFQMFAKRFPYAIYYDIIEKYSYVVAILQMRRDPAWISRKLMKRR